MAKLNMLEDKDMKEASARAEAENTTSLNFFKLADGNNYVVIASPIVNCGHVHTVKPVAKSTKDGSLIPAYIVCNRAEDARGNSDPENCPICKEQSDLFVKAKELADTDPAQSERWQKLAKSLKSELTYLIVVRQVRPIVVREGGKEKKVFSLTIESENDETIPSPPKKCRLTYRHWLALDGAISNDAISWITSSKDFLGYVLNLKKLPKSKDNPFGKIVPKFGKEKVPKDSDEEVIGQISQAIEEEVKGIEDYFKRPSDTEYQKVLSDFRACCSGRSTKKKIDEPEPEEGEPVANDEDWDDEQPNENVKKKEPEKKSERQPIDDSAAEDLDDDDIPF
jgi:hypothetical protein